MNLDELNKEIKIRYDRSIKYENQLSDKFLLDKFLNSKSYKNKTREIKKVLLPVLNQFNIEAKESDDILLIRNNEENKYDHKLLLFEILKHLSQILIAPGSKGLICGNKFNDIVFEYIKNYIKNINHLKLNREIKFPFLNEKADVILKNKKTKKTLIIYNQLTLWGGGHQDNRGGKYIIDDNLSNICNKNNTRLVCVISRYPNEIKTDKSKIYNLFSKGFSSKKLYYITDLDELINEFKDE